MTMKLTIVTILDGLTKETTALDNVDSSCTVRALKFWVQGLDSVPPKERHTPPFTDFQTAKEKDPHPDFSRVFFNGQELVEDGKTLVECGVEDGSMLRFAVTRNLAKSLRRRLTALTEKFPEEITASEEDKRDDMILSFLLDLFLQYHLRSEELGRRTLEALDRGEEAYFPDNNPDTLSRDGIEKELYKVFNPASLPVRFWKLLGGADGNTPYMGFAVEAKKAKNYKYKTCYGIPVTILHSNRIKKMACTAHWAMALVVGTEVTTMYGAGTVSQVREEDVVVALNWGGVGYLRQTKMMPRQQTSTLPNHSRGSKVGHLSKVWGHDDALVETTAFVSLHPTQYPLTANSPPLHAPIVRVSTCQTHPINGQVTYKSPNTNRMIVTRTAGGQSQQGDSNAIWLNNPQTHTVGIHSSLDPNDGTMTVLRIKDSRTDLAAETTGLHRSDRKKSVSRELFPGGNNKRPFSQI